MIGTHSDISERKRVEASLREARNTLEAIISGTSSVVGETFFPSLVECLAKVFAVRFAFVAEIDDKKSQTAKTIAFWNGEKIGENFSYDLCGTPCEQVVQKQVNVYAEHVAEQFPEDAWLRHNGVESYIGIPLSDAEGRFLGHMGIMDIQPIANSEYVLSLLKVFAARAASELERRRATEILQAKTEALQRSNADLEQFAYSVSHDMRQPLRSIFGHLQILEQDLADKLDDEARQNFHFAIDGARRMDAMIVSLLEFSRVGRKTEAMRWIESRELVDDAVMMLSAMIEESGARLQIDGSWPRVYVSSDELLRLFQNLIGNAMKYCEADRTPLVDIVSNAEAGLWRVDVSDNGIGIDPGQIERLFKFFSRLQSRARFEGTGMGLALCRRIVEHHGGRIWAQSDGEGAGSTFSFEIPMANETASRDAEHRI
ncbi:MAG: hypothetical protein Kow0065_03200 [Methylomicrobium sp.]